MNVQVLGLRVAGTIFGLVAFAQLLRLVTRTEVLVAGHPVPFWASGLAVIFSGGLSLWLWRLSSIRTPTGHIQ
jgi:hypothetical protein